MTIASLTAAAMLSFTACINVDYTIGSEYIDNKQDLTLQTVELDVPVGLKMADSLQSSAYTYMIGNIRSEEFGLTRVGLAATITPVGDYLQGDDVKLLDASMTMVLQSSAVLDESQASILQNLHIYPLTFEMDTLSIFCNSITEDRYRKEDLSSSPIVYSGEDTLKFKLKKEYAEKFLRATKEERDSTELFMKKYYGVYLTAEPPAGNAPGGRINKFGSITMELKYNSTNYAGYRRDTTVLFSIGNYYATQSYEHSSRHMELGSDNNAEVLPYEGLAGIKPYIASKDIRKIVEEWAASIGKDMSDILISKATLILPFEFPEDYTELSKWPAALYPTNRYSSSASYNLPQYSPLIAIYDDTFNRGEINRSLDCYRPDITMYMQAMLLAKPEDVDEASDLWIIAPWAYTESEGSSSGSSDYYNYLNYYNSLYSPYGYYGGYGGYGYGYGGYGYGGYGYGMSNYYNYAYLASLYSSSSSSSTTYYYTDYINYSIGYINGNGAERHPKIQIAYSVLE